MKFYNYELNHLELDVDYLKERNKEIPERTFLELFYSIANHEYFINILPQSIGS